MFYWHGEAGGTNFKVLDNYSRYHDDDFPASLTTLHWNAKQVLDINWGAHSNTLNHYFGYMIVSPKAV